MVGIGRDLRQYNNTKDTRWTYTTKTCAGIDTVSTSGCRAFITQAKVLAPTDQSSRPVLCHF